MALTNKKSCLTKKAVTYFRRRVLKWFRENGRIYPWRLTDNPYKILIAEMMLQRTRADQVESVYRDFFNHFDGPQDVAGTPQDKLNTILEPLGLRWRFKRFKQISQILVSEYDSRVPNRREQLRQLPGVGQYISGLVVSVAFSRKAWIVDSNVVRIWKRFFGFETKKEARRDDTIHETAKQYSQTTKPRQANLGIVDFGALVCKPRSPECLTCPVRRRCYFCSVHYSSGSYSCLQISCD